jgi:hypothetical protein
MKPIIVSALTVLLFSQMTSAASPVDRLGVPTASGAADAPFYCDRDALDPVRRTRHFDVLGPELVAKRQAVRELRDGYEFDFPVDSPTYQHVAEWIDGERECCPFFDITLRVAPDHGALTLRVTGRPGTKQFIQADGAEWIRPVRASN